jgi:hypothetical protein
MPNTPITFEDVVRLSDTGLGGRYRIGNRDVFVGSVLPMTGTTVFRIGQRGRLVLPRWFVEQERLALPA